MISSKKIFSRMSNGERIPRLSVGPYQQRPRPILNKNSLSG